MRVAADLHQLRAAAADGADLPYLAPTPGAPPIVTESGLPDPATFPVDDLAALYDEVLHDQRDLLQYGTLVDGELLYGPVGLRATLAERTPVGHPAGLDPRGVLLTAGAGHAIAVAARAFVGPGDVVAVECPSWDFILRDLAIAGADVRSVPLDDDGLDVDALEAELGRLRAEGRRLKLLYTIPTFNVPTGAVLSRSRRERLVELAAEHGFLILEDDVYGALRYDGEAQPSLLALDQAGLVIRVDSFSKTISPGLRLGWASAQPELIAAMASVRRDLGVSHLTARVLGRYLDSGRYDAHVDDVRVTYRTKRDVAVAAIGRHAEGLIGCRPPAGGYFLWLELAAGIDHERLHALAAAEGVIARPGQRFFAEAGRGADRLRLSFTEPSLDDMDRAAEVLGRAAKASVQEVA